MCAVFGYIGSEPAASIMLQGLLKLKYLGYDLDGVASINDDRLYLKKDMGKIEEIDERHRLVELAGNMMIAHTVSTNGGGNHQNAYPHIDCAEQIAVVHTGVVENYRELRQILVFKGHIFTSEIDAEVIPHLVEEYLKEGSTLEEAFLMTSKKLKGSYSLIAISAQEPQKMVAIKKDNPLIIGIGHNGTFVSSDTLCLDGCDRLIFPEDGELTILSKDGVTCLDMDGQQIKKEVSPLETKEQYHGKNGYKHFMLKEIMDEPDAIRNAIMQDKQLFMQIATDILEASKVVIMAGGASRYAALVGRYLFSEIAGKFSEVVTASEFQYLSKSIDKNTLVVAISQKSNNADFIDGVKRAKDNGARVISIVNRPSSILCYMSDNVIYLNCGSEIAMTATKSLVSQLVIFYLFSFSMVNQFDKAASSLTDISHEITRMLNCNRDNFKELAERLKNSRCFYYIASGINSPIAFDAALKLRETSCINAVGLPAGELKHGTLALIENQTPVVTICPNDNTFHETLENGIEAKSRGAFIIGVSDIHDKLFDFWIEVPRVDRFFYPFVSIVPLHLLAYYIAIEGGKDPDRLCEHS
jgi:glucosamine--fructose-6-phosphate aminotransferase (isomerizing)